MLKIILIRVFLSFCAIVVVAAVYLYVSLLPDIPKDQLTIENAGGHNNSQAPVLIFGATRNTGLAFARLLHARGERVVAFVRPTSDRGALEELGAEFLVGDAMDMGAVTQAFGSQSFRAAVTTVGCLKCEPPIDFVANRNIFDGAKADGVSQVMFVSTIGAGDSIVALPFLSKQFLKRMLPLKTQAEDYLKSSGLNYVTIRPGGLVNDAATGSGILSDDPTTFGYIGRNDLANLMLQCLDSGLCSGKTLSAVDENRSSMW